MNKLYASIITWMALALTAFAQPLTTTWTLQGATTKPSPVSIIDADRFEHGSGEFSIDSWTILTGNVKLTTSKIQTKTRTYSYEYAPDLVESYLYTVTYAPITINRKTVTVKLVVESRLHWQSVGGSTYKTVSGMVYFNGVATYAVIAAQ